MLHNKFWQAFFALTPLIIFFLFFIGYAVFLITLFHQVPEFEADQDKVPFAVFGGLGTFFFMLFLAIFLSLASLVFYIVHAVQNPNLQGNNLLLVWIILFIFVGGISQLLYWIIEIVNKRNSTG
ncbi:MAG: hypothetical protein WBM43_09035 [Flavobacteriaceae bacterium]